METKLDGQGSSARVTGAYVSTGRQHLDFDTLQEHAAPNTFSDLAFRGVLGGRSSAVWRGMIQVDPGAQKTDAFQECRNLLLSKKAHADAIPGLEIQADDVRCTHAAAIAQLDKEQLYYLQSHGLPESASQRLIIDGFLQELVARLAEGQIREIAAARSKSASPNCWPRRAHGRRPGRVCGPAASGSALAAPLLGGVRFFAAGRRFFAAVRFFAAGRASWRPARFFAAGRRFFAALPLLRGRTPLLGGRALLRGRTPLLRGLAASSPPDAASSQRSASWPAASSRSSASSRAGALLRRRRRAPLGRCLALGRLLLGRLALRCLPTSCAFVATVSSSFRSRLLRPRKPVPASFTSFSASRSWASFKSVLPPFLNSSRRSRRAFREASIDALARSDCLIAATSAGRRSSPACRRALRRARCGHCSYELLPFTLPLRFGWCCAA